MDRHPGVSDSIEPLNDVGATRREKSVLYGENLEENLQELSGKLKRMGYIPQPKRRTYVPKPGSEERSRENLRSLVLPSTVVRPNKASLKSNVAPAARKGSHTHGKGSTRF